MASVTPQDIAVVLIKKDLRIYELEERVQNLEAGCSALNAELNTLKEKSDEDVAPEVTKTPGEADGG